MHTSPSITKAGIYIDSDYKEVNIISAVAAFLYTSKFLKSCLMMNTHPNPKNMSCSRRAPPTTTKIEIKMRLYDTY